MFNQKIEEDSALEAEIARLLAAMTGTPPETKEYVTMTDQLTKLYALKPQAESRISKDTLLIVAGNLAGILTIVMAEKSSVLSAKGLSLLSKLR